MYGLFKKIENIFDGDVCFDYLKKIFENDRRSSFDAFAETGENCARFMREAGLCDVEVLPVKADGKTPHGDWVIPKAWDAKSATLKSADDAVTFADYNETPCSLIMYSAPTKIGGVTAKAVIADDAKTADSAELFGKIIVTTRPAAEFVELAIESGAVGIVSDFIPLYRGVRDNLDGMQDVSRWDNSSFSKLNGQTLFGFSLSPANGKKLRAMITETADFTIHAEVDTRIYDGDTYTVSGKIAGEIEDSVCIYGHLYEPGAHDNASGCAMILELARCINCAINAGILPKPRLTMNFVMGWECAGSMAWITAKDRRSVCGFVADMVGTDTVDNSIMCIWHAPMSNMTFADLYIERVIETYQEYKGARFDFVNKKFSIGTDNILSDPYFNMPSAAMITEPALSYHSSMDTPNRIQKDVLARNGVIVGAYLIGLASMSAEDAESLRIDAAEYVSKMIPDEDSAVICYYKSELMKIAEQTSNRFYPSPQTCSGTSRLMPADENLALVPTRKVAGCLTFDSRPDLADAKWQPSWSDELNLPLFWANGERNLWEITVLSAVESGQYDEKNLSERAERLVEYFKFLSNEGYVTLTQRA